MTNYLITGASGYIGSKLAKQLIKNGYQLICIVRKSSDLSLLESVKNDIKLIYWDKTVDSLIAGIKQYSIDVVFHLASCFIAEHKSHQVTDLIESNILFGAHLLEAMQQNGIKNMVNTGTSWQHYNNQEYDPVCLYAATKEAFEQLIVYYVKAHQFKCITLKLFDTYGSDDPRKKLVHLLVQLAKTKDNLKMSPGEQQLDLVHIYDVVRALIMASERLTSLDEVQYEEFAVTTQISSSLKEIVNRYEHYIGKKLNIEWGAKSYRSREVMKLWENYKILPNWQATYTFPEGLDE
ncbi:NAD-dependent epimerase/dehydratase family protein [Cysteiniphilum halobium]|uniref:NAD-dependent epimerase/dehydratase family protein n=1 Tax=Cysteiniphilum halobium TaxID=2219059 RepID=UPI000E646200|nr:NAD(P)-dependent oxidoreductase [Cysteiniphilum halobium]